MGAKTQIEWCDHTFNPWWGCTKVSPGCANCYAETWAKRTGHAVWGPHAPRTAEDQERADERLPLLLAVPAAVHFVSCEPLLGKVDMRRWLEPCAGGSSRGAGIGWVIAGGESGRSARGMDEGWVRSVRDQCTANAVPFFYKQKRPNATSDGPWTLEWALARGPLTRSGGAVVATPELDGRRWTESPPRGEPSRDGAEGKETAQACDQAQPEGGRRALCNTPLKKQAGCEGSEASGPRSGAEGSAAACGAGRSKPRDELGTPDTGHG